VVSQNGPACHLCGAARRRSAGASLHQAARDKGIVSPVAGKADILLVPDLEAGNMLAKQLSFMVGADAAGIVLGARVPIILTSRADNLRTRLASAAVAVLLAHAHRQAATAAPAAQ
jgi:phosphotransacetylase